jgi:drug/metabolite transporter (DMT)-like permease
VTTADAAVRTAPRLTGGLLVVLSAIGYGLLALFATRARHAGLDEVAVMAFRFTLAAAALWVVVAARRPATPPRPAIAAALVLGGLCWSVQAVAYLFAVTRAGAPLAALLLYTYPLMVVTVAVVAGRQRWHRRLGVAFGLVLAGLALVFGTGLAVARLDPLGVAAGVVAAVTYTTFILASEPLSARIDPFLFTALAMTGAAWATGLLTVARGGVPAGSVVQAGVPLLGLALLSTVVPAVAFLVGMRRVGAPTAAILSCAEVAVTCVVAWAALGDRLTPVQLAGCAAVVVAVVVLNRRTAPRS